MAIKWCEEGSPFGLYSFSYRSISLIAVSTSFATGFSDNVCLPACHACSSTSGCTRIGIASTTVSMSLRAKSSVRVAPSESAEKTSSLGSEGCDAAASMNDWAVARERE